jgi:hypothetical protein
MEFRNSGAKNTQFAFIKLISIFTQILINKMTKNNTVLFVIATVFVASVSRLIPHLPNFTPIIAMSLMAGSVLQNKRLSLLVVLLSMFVSDVLTIHFINYSFTTYSGYFFSFSAVSVYASIIAIVLFGDKLANFKPSARLALAGVSAGLFFWLITNFALWMSGIMYPTNAAGLSTCFAMAIPFLSNQLIGDVLFTLVFASLFSLMQNTKVLQSQKI